MTNSRLRWGLGVPGFATIPTGTRRAGMGIAGLAVVAAATALSFPTASADITGSGMTVQGDTHGIGGNYQVCVTNAESYTYAFFFNTTSPGAGGTTPLGMAAVNEGVACIMWAPSVAGPNHLYMSEGSLVVGQVDVLVGSGTPPTTTPPTTTPPTTTAPPTTTPVPAPAWSQALRITSEM